MEKEQLKNKYLQQIFQYIQDGIIIMNHNREILMMNPSAMRLTGWELGNRVPFCSFCENRQKSPTEHTCYLIEHNEVPYFLSKMLTYHGCKIDVEISTALMYTDSKTNEQEFLLVLRDQTLQLKEEEARISKLIIKQLIEAKEEEHKRLAQELHDGVGQSLFTISVALQAIESYVKDNEKLNTYIEEVRNELGQVMNDIKLYSYQLRPQSIDQLGISPTLGTLVDSVQKVHPGISIVFETDFEERCHPSVEINIYRVVQEALHNIVKYAKASKVVIRLEKKAGDLALYIEDNGVGFDLQLVKKEGLGLKHMEERITLLGGSFNITSAYDKGTKISIQVPNWKDDYR
ncbi:PAS domain-containing sensor histidine kinase [Lysinibacillus sp. G4S2]|uniref:PAS domain-containing sensor histidine kinase n=1 Tax=Lysinibacillus sp. G4S2 TaxID=3055859 RepID=UPI0025A0DB01|nr:PAS domain-containing sensor histidine kinase [Lysinibacillus sp. G4S2]MDM5246017.1 PAS domain-containing sensor histidine kinase [Lysinibacillus sp. G4S2]